MNSKNPRLFTFFPSGMEDEKPPCEKRNPCYNILQSDRELQLQIAINCQAKTRFHAENSAANFKL
jgi:hypothetical protein